MVRVMVFNGIFNNISAISWRSVLLLEETGVPGENHRPATSHIMLHRVHLSWTGFEFPTLVVIGTHCIGSYKSNYHTITTTTAADVSINYWSIDPLHIPDLFLKLYVFIGVYFLCDGRAKWYMFYEDQQKGQRKKWLEFSYNLYIREHVIFGWKMDPFVCIKSITWSIQIVAINYLYL